MCVALRKGFFHVILSNSLLLSRWSREPQESIKLRFWNWFFFASFNILLLDVTATKNTTCGNMTAWSTNTHEWVLLQSSSISVYSHSFLHCSLLQSHIWWLLWWLCSYTLLCGAGNTSVQRKNVCAVLQSCMNRGVILREWRALYAGPQWPPQMACVHLA